MSSNRTDVVSFLSLALAYGTFLWSTLDAGLDTPGLLGRVIGFYVAVAIAVAVIQIVVEWTFGKPAASDKDFEREIGRRSGRNAYFAVLSILWAIPFLLAIPELGVTLTALACVAAIGLGEVVRYGSRIAYRGLGQVRNQRALAG